MGLAVSLAPALHTGRFNCLPLYDALASSPSWRPATVVRLSNLAYRRLRDFWLHLSPSQCGCDWDVRDPTELLFTDASDFGYGAHLSKLTHQSLVSGLWSPSLAVHHITFKELKVVELAL